MASACLHGLSCYPDTAPHPGLSPLWQGPFSSGSSLFLPYCNSPVTCFIAVGHCWGTSFSFLENLNHIVRLKYNMVTSQFLFPPVSCSSSSALSSRKSDSLLLKLISFTISQKSQVAINTISKSRQMENWNALLL